jgi:hypothetical protein
MGVVGSEVDSGGMRNSGRFSVNMRHSGWIWKRVPLYDTHWALIDTNILIFLLHYGKANFSNVSRTCS